MVEIDQPESKTIVRDWRVKDRALVFLTILFAVLHGAAFWLAIGGREGLTNGFPIWRHDHPLYFHSALVTQAFLKRSWTTAGYDPTFMSGYAKSVIFPASSTLPELVIALFGGSRPDLAYKLYVLVSAAAIPWLVALSAAIWKAGPGGTCLAVALFLIYVWTDFPLSYASTGMLPYLLAIPLGLLATGVFVRYCDRGGLGWWLLAAFLLSMMVMVHFTSALIVAPAAGAAYLSALFERSEEQRATFSRSRHLGVWLIPVVVLVVNAFWWMPGIWLASTKGESGFVFTHPEGVLERLRQIVTTAVPIERVLWATGAGGLPVLIRRGRKEAAGLLAFATLGFFWGYLAGGLRALDFLQPGRHTYALYTALTVLAGIGLSQSLVWLRAYSRVRLDLAGACALALTGTWFFGPTLRGKMDRYVLSKTPFLSSEPTPNMLWVMNRVRQHVNQGERILYEEGGFELEEVPDPYKGGRLSGLLPALLGVEVIGGPYLHSAVKANFTQFGEGKLFGRMNWDRDWFVRYARLYRPSAILCWSPRALAFCRANPDLIQIKEDAGQILIGRVLGFEGVAITGRVLMSAEPGRLMIMAATGGLDGTVVLRYHSVPCLRADPPVALDSVFLEDDPVPFIRLRPPPGSVVIELRFPPTEATGPGR